VLTLLKKLDVDKYIHKDFGLPNMPSLFMTPLLTFPAGFESTVRENHGIGYRRTSLTSFGTRRRGTGNREGF